MTRILPLAVVGLIALSFGGIGANAQAPPAQTPSQPGAANAPPASGGEGPPPSTAAEGMHLPVLIVTSIEVLRSPRGGGMDIVRARGLASSFGWREPHLLPITSGKTLDGTLDLIFQAVAPAQPGPPGPLMTVEAILPVETAHPYKAVRVRSATNAVTLKTLPGYVEITEPKLDLSKYVGKYFLAKGAAAPAGIAAADVVKEADMPWTVRVIKPTDGVPNYVYDANRLTVVLTEDGRINDIAWD